MTLDPFDPSLQPYWLPDTQPWAVQQERMRHNQAMFSWGEYAMFVLLWDVDDFEAGLIGRCSVCYLPYGKVSETFNQPAKRKCLNCFGTTFEGGYKAKVVRPSMWDVAPDINRLTPHGEVLIETLRVQSTSDFRMRRGDYILRGDGTRWQVRDIAAADTLETGFGPSNDENALVAYNYRNASREDESSVVYLIPPIAVTELRNILHIAAGSRFPADFSAVDEIRGGLL